MAAPPRPFFGRVSYRRWNLGKRSKKSAARERRSQNQPIRLPGLKPGGCSGLILSGAFYPDLKIGVWRRRTYQTDLREGILNDLDQLQEVF